MNPQSPRIAFVHSPQLIEDSLNSPTYKNRFQLLDKLMSSYKIYNRLLRVQPLPLPMKTVEIFLARFHHIDYIHAVRELSYLAEDNAEIYDQARFEHYGLLYDCPYYKKMFEFAADSAQCSLLCSDALFRKRCKVGINWFGGWHHANKSSSSGYCYFNDINLCINKALDTLKAKVLYIDLDLHHGDGVEKAFSNNPDVITFSVHHFAVGFFPSTGDIIDIEKSSSYSSFNVPLKKGANDVDLIYVVKPFLKKFKSLVNVGFIIVQCGADGLTRDPHKIFNLKVSQNPEESIYLNVLQEVFSWDKPVLLLGGGGYNFPDTARLWTILTNYACEYFSDDENIKELPKDIPENEYLDFYKPDFEIIVDESVTWKNENTTEYLNDIKLKLDIQLEYYCNSIKSDSDVVKEKTKDS